MRMFEDFSKLEVRTETIPEKSDLEKVLDVEKEIIKQYENDKRFEPYKGKHFEAYESLCQSTQEKLTDVTLIPEILQSYIDARDNTEENIQTIIRGMYSSAVLEIILARQPDSYTFIDGREKTFNHLFYCIHHVKNLTLQNIAGNNILYNAGRNNRNIKNIILQNITGNNILYNAGSDKGSVANIILDNVVGYNTLRNAGNWHGIVSNITLNNVKGDNILYQVSWKGNAKNITLNNVKGHNILYDAGRNGSVANITLKQTTGNNILWNAGSDKGSVANILREYQLTEKQKNILLQIETIAKTIHTLSFEQQEKAHDEIAELKEEIFLEKKK